MDLFQALRALEEAGVVRLEVSLFETLGRRTSEVRPLLPAGLPPLSRPLQDFFVLFLRRFLKEYLGTEFRLSGGRGRMLLDLAERSFLVQFFAYGPSRREEMASYSLKEAARAMGWPYGVPPPLLLHLYRTRGALPFLDPQAREARFLRGLERWAMTFCRGDGECVGYRIDLQKGRVVFYRERSPVIEERQFSSSTDWLLMRSLADDIAS